MVITNLKEVNLDELVDKLEPARLALIRKEQAYFDEYYLASENKIIKCFRQEFVKDPYMGLEPIPEVRLIQFDEGTPPEDLESVFQKDKVPIIIREPLKSALTNFKMIKNHYGGFSRLIPIEIDIATPRQRAVNTCIRPLEKDYLLAIEELFRKEYSLRYRMVKMIWSACPEACFVYEQQGNICGVTLNALERGYLRLRQLFVQESARGNGIGTELYLYRLNFALQNGIKKAKGTTRSEARNFHQYFHMQRRGHAEYYKIRK